MIALECLVRFCKGKDAIRINESIMSMGHGLTQLFTELACIFFINVIIKMFSYRVLFKGSVLGAYVLIYENYCLYKLPWNSTLTWVVAALAYDCGYYWFHRACHGMTQQEYETHRKCYKLSVSEINVLWAAHQVHHSSEDYNLTTALRQSMFQHLTAWVI